MRHGDIRVGMTLRLKRERQEAYGREDPLVRVDGIIERPGYKVPWIWQAAGSFEDELAGRGEYYAPSDFANEVLP